MTSILDARLRRNPPRTQEDIAYFTVRQSLAAYGEYVGYWRIRGACYGMAKGLFGEAWETAPKAQKLSWYRMMLDQYQIATAARGDDS